MRQVRAERTFWRDRELSLRHKKWGWDCPAIDIDFLMIEYDTGQVVAIVEYKNENAKQQVAEHPSWKAIIDLGNRATLPVFCVRYATDFSWWKVIPLNKFAFKVVPQRIVLDEQEYIGLLYQLRGRGMPTDATVMVR